MGVLSGAMGGAARAGLGYMDYAVRDKMNARREARLASIRKTEQGAANVEWDRRSGIEAEDATVAADVDWERKKEITGTKHGNAMELARTNRLTKLSDKAPTVKKIIDERTNQEVTVQWDAAKGDWVPFNASSLGPDMNAPPSPQELADAGKRIEDAGGGGFFGPSDREKEDEAIRYRMANKGQPQTGVAQPGTAPTATAPTVPTQAPAPKDAVQDQRRAMLNKDPQGAISAMQKKGRSDADIRRIFDEAGVPYPGAKTKAPGSPKSFLPEDKAAPEEGVSLLGKPPARREDRLGPRAVRANQRVGEAVVAANQRAGEAVVEGTKTAGRAIKEAAKPAKQAIKQQSVKAAKNRAAKDAPRQAAAERAFTRFQRMPYPDKVAAKKAHWQYWTPEQRKKVDKMIKDSLRPAR